MPKLHGIYFDCLGTLYSVLDNSVMWYVTVDILFKKKLTLGVPG